jgi:hypothetical protein
METGRSAALALLLAVALLVCHGVLGSHHEAQQAPTGDLHQHASGYASHESHGGDSGAGHEGRGGGCSSCVTSYAVLLVLSLGAMVGALLNGARPWTGIAAPLLSPPGSVPHMLRLARGPTLPLLQVFRL